MNNKVGYNIIGDIAGQYDAFLELLDKMPADNTILSVGDLIDRGPKSKEVLDWFMSHPEHIVLYGNHEDMMVGAQTSDYWKMNWAYNGGTSTMESISVEERPAYVAWLKTLPMYLQVDGLLVSHAPVFSDTLPKDPYGRGFDFFWNRHDPRPRKDTITIHGHNGKYQTYENADGTYSYCIDDSHNGNLMGITWPQLETYTVEISND